MNKVRLKFSIFIASLVIGFCAGHALGSECPTHQPDCGYAVAGCFLLTYPCSGGQCWREWGNCCDDKGTDFSVFCGPGCDGGGGGSCGLQM